MISNVHATRILCYGDSNTWGWVPDKMGNERFDISIRWPGVMQKELGTNYEVIEESLGARTTSFDEPRPELPLRNGALTLPIIMESHAPLAMVVIMLGTAECKPLFDKSIEEIGAGLQQLLDSIRTAKTVNEKRVERIIIVAPPIVNDTVGMAKELYAGSTPKTRELVEEYRRIASSNSCTFYDSNQVVAVDAVEGIHITAESHQNLGKALAQVILS